MSLRRIFFATCLGALVVPAAAFVAQAVRLERPHAAIMQLVASAAPDERALPEPVRRLLLFSLHGRTTPYASRLVMRELDRDALRTQGTYKSGFPLWALVVAVGFSEDRRLALIAHLAPTGRNRIGLARTSLAMFDRPLSELSLAQAATLVVLTKQPSLYDRPDRLAAAREEFLSRYEGTLPKR